MRKFSILAVVLMLLILSAVPVFAQGTVADVAAATPDLSTLVAAVQAADPSVAAALSGDGPITVFAPSNTAFANLDAFLAENYNLSLDDVLANTELLTQILTYHVVPGTYFSSQLAELNDQIIPSALAGTGIGITVSDGTITLNSVADVILADVGASNGVVHVIDQVILPGVIIAEIEEAAATAEAAAARPTFTSVRIAHFGGDVRSVDIFVNGERFLASLQYGDVTDWARLPSGSYEIAVTNAGSAIDQAIVGPLTVELNPNRWVTIAATGLRANGSLTANVVSEILPDLDDGESYVTVLHSIPDAPAVDVLAGEDALVRDLFYPNTFSAKVPAGSYDLTVVTSVAGSDLTLIDAPGTEFEPLYYYFVAAYGTAADPQVFVSSISAEDVALINSGRPIYRDPASSSDAGSTETTAEATETPAVEATVEATEEPATEEAATGTVADLVIAATEDDPAEFTILLAVVQASDPAVLEALSSEGPITVFAPTDAAFTALLETLGVDVDTALTQTDLLTQVLLYHVIEGELSGEDIAGETELATLGGESIVVSVEGDSVVLNGTVNVTTADIAASNGVVHVIDAVLIPPSVAALLGL
ncbi:MAG: fasciclin domain-containing protein, partial [Chitinophagaceae bacterium]|nr:fasciclin domain-containing protein [Anaerolineae bacterium]